MIVGSQLRNVTMQYWFGQADNAKRRRALPNGSLILGGLLWISIDQQDAPAFCGERRSQIDGNRRLPGAALLIDHCDNHNRAL